MGYTDKVYIGYHQLLDSFQYLSSGDVSKTNPQSDSIGNWNKDGTRGGSRCLKDLLRMEPTMFSEMVERLTPRISKHQDCGPGLPAGLRLAIALRILATGESYHSLAFSFRVSHTTLSLLVFVFRLLI